MRRLVRERADLLRLRAAAGWIREGHGDLRTEHVCLEADGAVQIFDCVEFNRDVRCADVTSDLAFLLMDLTRHGASQHAEALLGHYRRAGLDLPDELLRFYWAHRALVRGKIACLGFAAASPPAAMGRAVKSADYLDLAAAAAVTVSPLLVIMTGLSGTGKSSVAKRLARALGAHLLASDVVRKELAGIAGPAAAAWGEGVYRADWTAATYERIFSLAEARLAARAPVVLDATFLTTEQRAGAAAVASKTGARLALVETVCDEATVAARLAARAEGGDSPSDATMATHTRQRAAVSAAPPAVQAGTVAIQVDTAGAMPVSLDAVFAALAREGIVLPVVPTSPLSVLEGNGARGHTRADGA
jgi:predicted kinase